MRSNPYKIGPLSIFSDFIGSILKVGDNPLFQGKFSIAFRFEKLEFEFGWPALLYVLFFGGILSKEC